MGIFSKLVQGGELRRLRKAARKQASPETIGALAERYIALGRLDDAERTAEAGLGRFPASERLQKVCTFAKKHRRKEQIARLRKEMREHPTPSVYSQLAEIHRELGGHDEALTICRECIEKFPLNENPYLITGEIRLARFIADRIAHDGLESERQLQRVVKLNAQNLKAHLLLGQLYFFVGALEPMKQHLSNALTLSPGSTEIEEFLARADAGEYESGALEFEEDDFLDDEDGLTVDELIRSVEAARSLRNEVDLFPQNRLLTTTGPAAKAYLDVEGLRGNLGRIGTGDGIRNAVILDRDGEVLADMSDPDSLTRKQFAELVSDIVATSEDTSRRMDIGSFQWCTIEGNFGGITINRVKNISLGMKYDHTVKPERAHRMLEGFASRNLTADPEVSRA
ncbi:MAG: roadblock/LC7 domain-containing protein [Planctomycetota bacterium]